jgi:small basic protein
LLAGCVLMGAVLGIAFEAGFANTMKSILALFVLNVLGYFAGGWYEQYPQMFDAFQKTIGLDRRTAGNVAATLWGVFYGVTFGAGIGLAFYFCQSEARERLLKIRPS